MLFLKNTTGLQDAAGVLSAAVLLQDTQYQNSMYSESRFNAMVIFTASSKVFLSKTDLKKKLQVDGSEEYSEYQYSLCH